MLGSVGEGRGAITGDGSGVELCMYMIIEDDARGRDVSRGELGITHCKREVFLNIGCGLWPFKDLIREFEWMGDPFLSFLFHNYMKRFYRSDLSEPALRVYVVKTKREKGKKVLSNKRRYCSSLT